MKVEVEKDVLEKVLSKLEELDQRDPEYMTIEQASKFTTFAESTLYGFVNKKKVPFVKKSGKVLFEKQMLVKWLREDTFDPGVPKSFVPMVKIKI